MRKLRLLALAMVGVMGLSLGLTGCGETKTDDKKTETTKKEDDKKEEAKDKAEDKKDEPEKQAEKPGESGFEEFPVADQIELGPYVVAPVYFQPVDMYPKQAAGTSKEDSACHLEADIHLLPEKSQAFGFGAPEEGEDGELEGAWVPYLTVKYEIVDKDGKTTDEGVFMPMNASDGPHYGGNIKKEALKDGEQYKLKLTIVPPSEYLLHIDDETGVDGAKGGKKEYEEFYKELTHEFDWSYAEQWQ
ncbi:MAG: iron transporter [Eubacteriales bacterium]|nr:iron transporter [Eubacteriales bacterium]